MTSGYERIKRYIIVLSGPQSTKKFCWWYLCGECGDLYETNAKPHGSCHTVAQDAAICRYVFLCWALKLWRWVSQCEARKTHNLSTHTHIHKQRYTIYNCLHTHRSRAQCVEQLTSRKKSTAMTWKVGLILRMVWISFHSLATKYVLQMLTVGAWVFPSPQPEACAHGQLWSEVYIQ